MAKTREEILAELAAAEAAESIKTVDFIDDGKRGLTFSSSLDLDVQEWTSDLAFHKGKKGPYMVFKSGKTNLYVNSMLLDELHGEGLIGKEEDVFKVSSPLRFAIQDGVVIG